MNELDKGTKEKTRIFGTILNSNNRDPVKDASITLSIEGTQIAAITSDELGGYEYTAEEDYTGQTLDFSIQKEGFIGKDISHEIDRFEIESDILMDEIEIKIEGKICDETDSPLDNASISFSIGGSTIDLVSDKDGSFSFTVGQQFLNQSIGYEVNKEGFKITSGKLKLLENLKCINISKSIPPIVPDKSKWIKNAVVGIGLICLTVLVIYLFGLAGGPELSIDPDAIDFDFEPGTGAQTFSIRNNGDGTLEWNVYSDRDWIIISADSGTDSGTVSVIVNSADMDPGRYTGRITVESNGGTETGTISLYIPPEIEEPTDEPTLGALRIHYFRANPEHMDLEGETKLSWEISGATSATIDGVGPVEVSKGSIDRWVEQTTTFILRATNEAGISDVRTVTVTVEVQIPELSINPDPLDLNYGTIDEGDTDSKTFSISNTGSGTLEWSISTEQPWITVSPTSGTNSGEVIVTVNTAGLGPGNSGGIITIESNGGELKQGDIYLTVSSEQPTVGSIDVSSSPSGASIYFDGSYQNITPMTIQSIEVGSYTITLEYTGYQDWSQTIYVVAGETTSVTASLTPYEHSISNIQLDPHPPKTLLLTSQVEVTFDYAITETGGVRIFVRPFTNGSLTPHYVASRSPLYPTGQGKGEGYFSITSKEVTVDQLRFQMISADQSRVLYEYFIPVNYSFYSSK